MLSFPRPAVGRAARLLRDTDSACASASVQRFLSGQRVAAAPAVRQHLRTLSKDGALMQQCSSRPSQIQTRNYACGTAPLCAARRSLHTLARRSQDLSQTMSLAPHTQTRGFIGSFLLKRYFEVHHRRQRNFVDRHRMHQIGAEMLCAEWVLQSVVLETLSIRSLLVGDGLSDVHILHSGAVRFHGIAHVYRDFEFLPRPVRFVHVPPLVVEAIDCSRLDVTDEGLRHIIFLSRLRELRLVKCQHLTDAGLRYVAMVSRTLLRLSLKGCQKLTAKSIQSLSQLQALEVLDIRDTALATDAEHLKRGLPNCRLVH